MRSAIFWMLGALISLAACKEAGPSSELVEARQQIADLEQQVADLEKVSKPGFIHTVYFWLKEGTTDEQKEAFERGMESLREVASVRALHFGPPAMTPRDVVDNSYDYGLTMFFEDAAGQDAYQVDAIHEKLIEDHRDIWERVQVYDTMIK